MTNLSGFTFRYAVRMPNGELYRHPQVQQQVVDYSRPSPMRDMSSWMEMLGMGGRQSEPKPVPPGPVIFDNRKDAELLLKDIQSRAAAVGVTHWGGTVVTQLCTPFTPGDPAEDFWPALVTWLRAQGIDA